MSIADSRRFPGLMFGITISASDLPGDVVQTSDEDVNRLTFQEASHILREGGRLVLGHKWKLGGVMHHLASKARDLRLWQPSPTQGQVLPPSIINVVAWPDQRTMEGDATARRLFEQSIMEVRQVAFEGLDLSQVSIDSDLGKFCRIRSLTRMRQEIVRLTDVRICLGGGSNKKDRRLSGVLEEAIVTIQARKPLYLSSALGGVSRLIADVLLQRKVSEDGLRHFYTPQTARETIQAFDAEYPCPPEEGPSIRSDAAAARWNAFDYLRSVSLEELAATACLSMDEYINLLTTADLNRALTLVMQEQFDFAPSHMRPDQDDYCFVVTMKMDSCCLPERVSVRF